MNMPPLHVYACSLNGMHITVCVYVPMYVHEPMFVKSCACPYVYLQTIIARHV